MLQRPIVDVPLTIEPQDHTQWIIQGPLAEDFGTVTSREQCPRAAKLRIPVLRVRLFYTLWSQQPQQEAGLCVYDM